MKFFSKLFITVTLILCISLSLSGYLLISLSFQNAIEQEKSQALDQYQLTRFTLQSRLVSLHMEQTIDKQVFSSFFSESLQPQTSNALLAVFSPEKKLLYSNYPEKYDFSILGATNPDNLVYEIQPANDSYFLSIAGCLTRKNQTFYLIFGKNIDSAIQQRKQMEHSFSIIYCTVCTLSLLALLLFSLLFSRPLKKMAFFAGKIAEGDYSSRIAIRTHDEFGELAVSCNHMADAIQESIEHLTRNAIQKEDFVASFAHELKTPLTSVIGYADMIYQKDLTKEETRNAAWYILDEGMRLEELSRKLMDLIVLERQTFILEELSARELLDNLAETLRPICEARKVTLQIEAADCYIRVEYDLFKTLLLNLADNAIKAGSSAIVLSGKPVDAGYQIQVSDNGCGIPESEIDRVTEAFYMVDKSRSRKQHGAGIGLALVSQIAKLHQARLDFTSTLHVGTTVSITLPNCCTLLLERNQNL